MFERNFEEKIFEGRTRPFRASAFHTPGTPLRRLILHVIKMLRYYVVRRYAVTCNFDPDF